MVKLINLITRKPGMSREAFIEHYETRHAPLAMRLFPQIVKYVRNYSVGTENLHYAGRPHTATIPYDAITEQWFKDQESYDEMIRMFMSDPQKFKELAEDESRFMDTTRAVMYLVEERHTEI
jgi:uncharacterized protein (TIGR02118 family)